MSLKDGVQKLRDDISGYAQNPMLDCIDSDFINILDNNNSDLFLTKTKSDLENIITTLKPNIVGNNNWGQFFETYNEAYIYWKLWQKGVVIKHLREQGNGKKTPDFEIDFNGNKIHIEMKSLGMTEAMLKYKEIQEDSLNVAVDVEKQHLSGKQVAMGEHVIQPMKKSGDSSYDPCNAKMVVDEILEKIEQNLKTEQFEYSDKVFMFVDLRLLGTLGKPNEMIKKVYNIITYYSRPNTIEVSGALWHVAFGKEPDIIKWANFDDSYKKGQEPMARNGLLTSYPAIKGMLFQVEQMEANKAEFVGLVRQNEPVLKNLFTQICGNNVEIA